jgi:lactoylglutathione lyase
MIKIGHTTIYVEDVLKTIEFYKEAFSMNLKFLYETNDYAEMELGEKIIAFCSESFVKNVHKIDFNLNRQNKQSAGVEIAFMTDDVDALFYKVVSLGAISVSKPEMKVWGQKVGYLRDLNGFLIEICSTMN